MDDDLKTHELGMKGLVKMWTYAGMNYWWSADGHLWCAEDHAFWEPGKWSDEEWWEAQLDLVRGLSVNVILVMVFTAIIWLAFYIG